MSRNPATVEHESAVLVHQGMPRFTIVIADRPTDVVLESVEELNYWIERISNVTLPVVTETNWAGHGGYIAIGPSRWTRANGWEDGEFAQEEARVFIRTDRIGLIGHDASPYPGTTWRGTYYAVVEFVRRALQVLWIWPGPLGEVFTPRSTIAVAPGEWKWAPDLTLVRDIRNLIMYRLQEYINRAEADYALWSLQPEGRRAIERLAAEQEKWLKRQRMNQATDVRFAHAFGDWWERFGKEHPDWFARPPEDVEQVGGRDVQLNLSHPEVIEQIIADWQEKRRQNPDRHRVLPVSPNDGRGFDTRPETRAWDHPSLQIYSDEEIWNSPDPVLTDRHLRFWNTIARKVATIDPRAVVTTYAYRNYQAPPLGSGKVEPNVIIAYVGGEAYYPDEPHLRREWRGWFEREATLVWRPNLLHAGHGVPYLYSKQLYEDFRFFRDHGMQGTYFDSMTGNWAGQGLNYYVLAEQHVRPDASYEALAGEYFAAFGKAADAVRAYHEFFEEQTRRMPDVIRSLTASETWGGWWVAHMRSIPIFLTPEVVAAADGILARAEKAVQDDDAIYRERVRLIRLGFEHARLMATCFRRLRLHEPGSRLTYDDAEAREILQPLWDFRLQASTMYLLPVVRYLIEEQKRLGLWSAFLTPQAASRKSLESQVLTGVWSYRADPLDDGLNAAWYAQTRASGDWDSLAPNDSKRTEAMSTSGGAVHWFRFLFRAPVLPDTGARVTLVLHPGRCITHVWLNGLPVLQGSVEQGASEARRELDLSHCITDGADNLFVLRAANCTAPDAIVTGVEVRFSREL